MEHTVRHNGRFAMVFTIEDEVIVCVTERYTEIYNAETNEKDHLIQALGELAIGVGGRKGAEEVENVLKLAPKTEVPLIAVRKYVSDSGGQHREYIEKQILRLTEEIAELHNSLDVQVDWGM
jgi:predicted nucleic-acid-binding Zn-ribbon protein